MAARRMALMRVEYPLPYPFNHARTSRSSRTATNSFDFGRNADASCSSVSGGMSEKSISDSGAAASRSSDPRWRFVSGLLKIDSDFTLTSLSNRDDADEFFAIFCLPIDVSHDQQGLSAASPRACQRRSPLSSVLSSMSTKSGSANTRAAVAKSTPCFVRLTRFFAASYSSRMPVIRIV